MIEVKLTKEELELIIEDIGVTISEFETYSNRLDKDKGLLKKLKEILDTIEDAK